MTADTPDLTVAELEQIRDATLRTYEGGDEQYNTLPPHLLKVVDGDGGLIHMIDLAIRRTKERDQIAADAAPFFASEYITLVRPGTLAKMRAEKAWPSRSFREAIARARQRRENPNG